MGALYAQLSEQVRTAITSAERVRLARESSVAVAENADRIYAHFQDRIGVPSASGTLLNGTALPLTLLGVAAVALLLLALLFANIQNRCDATHVSKEHLVHMRTHHAPCSAYGDQGCIDLIDFLGIEIHENTVADFVFGAAPESD